MRPLGFVLLAACSAPAASTAAPLVSADVVFVEQGDVVLSGTLTGVPEDSDAEPVYRLHAVRGGQPIDDALEGRRVLDATLAGEVVVLIGEDHVLRARVGGADVELDSEVTGPLSAAGDRVAYARGSMPFYELAIADLAAGTARTLTEGMSPVWSPALAPSGDEVVFVSGASGTPRLVRLTLGGETTVLPELGAFPSSPRAPRYDGRTLAFEDESGQPHLLDLRVDSTVSP